MSRNPDRCPTHPGELLREDVIPATGKPKAEIARMLGISRQHLYDILAERKPVSPEVAVRLAKLFGNAPLVWIRMQGAYDAWHAAREVDVSAVPTAAVLNAVGHNLLDPEPEDVDDPADLVGDVGQVGSGRGVAGALEGGDDVVELLLGAGADDQRGHARFAQQLGVGHGGHRDPGDPASDDDHSHVRDLPG